MSMVQQLIAAVSVAERQIEDQIQELHTYISELDQAADRIHGALSGSTQNYGQEMLRQLFATRADVTRSIGQLQVAKQKLQKVKMI